MIYREDPAVVFLQEVVPQTLDILEKECPEYQILSGGRQGYFTAMLIKVGVVILEDHDVQMFYSSRMMRNILSAKVKRHQIYKFIFHKVQKIRTKKNNNTIPIQKWIKSQNE